MKATNASSEIHLTSLFNLHYKKIIFWKSRVRIFKSISLNKVSSSRPETKDEVLWSAMFKINLQMVTMKISLDCMCLHMQWSVYLVVQNTLRCFLCFGLASCAYLN